MPHLKTSRPPKPKYKTKEEVNRDSLELFYDSELILYAMRLGILLPNLL